MENSNIDNYKQMADLCLNLYIDCVKYKKQKEKDKNLNCDIYYNNFEYFSFRNNDEKSD